MVSQKGKESVLLVEAHKWPSPDQVRKVWDNLITAAASGASNC